jgi:hypothetical protein
LVRPLGEGARVSPKRERTLYEIASSFFAAVVIAFAVAGLLVTGLGEDGPGSAGFLVCLLFLGLGLGRLYLGLRRGNEGAEKPVPAPPAEPDARTPPPRRPPPHRRRP